LLDVSGFAKVKRVAEALQFDLNAGAILDERQKMKAKIGAFLALLAVGIVFAANDSIDDRLIKVTTLAKVESTRAALIEYIWASPWATVAAKQPNAVQHNYVLKSDDTLPAGVDNLQSIDRLDATTTESTKAGQAEAVPSNVFIFYPLRGNNHRAVIVHQGHGCEMTDTDERGVHLEIAIRELVAAGYTVAAMRMPRFQSPSDCGVTRVHDKLFDAPLEEGSPLKFFMEPIARTVNYLRKENAGLKEIDMVGLSGGGWTTTLYAAIDPRIVKSFPVAGSLPLYLRADNYNHDLEQYFAPIYQVAGYKDLYVLGASGKGRLQMQILNRYDDCCFGERQHKVGPTPYPEAIREYERDVQMVLQKMHSGTFALHLDLSAHYHQISKDAIERVILPVLAGGKPPSY
jgi:pimeloyl-ACP methyl ester carboxylesterase